MKKRPFDRLGLIPIASFIFCTFCLNSGPIVGRASAAGPPKFELLDGDRVVFLGNTLIEREQKYGIWELMLTMAWPERNVTFRNLGWSGDTVWGESRAGFGTQADGYKALVEQVNAAKPTVIFVGYGNVEAFAGVPGLPKFAAGFNKLLDDLERTKARIVIVSPLPMMGRPQNKIAFTDAFLDAYNKPLSQYQDLLRNVAASRSHWFVNSPVSDIFIPSHTVDGMIPNLVAYSASVATSWGKQLHLPVIVAPYNGSNAKWNPAAEVLRQTLIKKNELFFHRWRPQNETYLFGFRKHEQGNNAKEVFEFDPLVAAEEKKIAELRIELAAELQKETSDAK